MVEKKKLTDKGIESLKGKAKLIGIDVDSLLEQLSDIVSEKALERIEAKLEQLKPPPMDLEAVAYRVADILKDSLPKVDIEEVTTQAEAHLAGKITNTLQLVNEKLSSNLEEAKKAIFAELTVIKETIPTLIDQKQVAFREEIAGYLKELPQEAKQGGGGLGQLSSLLSPDVVNTIVSRLMTPPQADQGKILEATIRGLLLGQRIKQGEARIEDLAGVFGVGQTTKPGS